MEIREEKPVSLPQLKKYVASIAKRDEEKSHRVQRMVDYLSMFNAAHFKQVEQLIKNLQALELPRMKEQHIYKLAELMPKTPEDAKLVLQGYPLIVSAENLKKIAQVVTDTLSEKK